MIFCESPLACVIILSVLAINAISPFVKGVLLKIIVSVNICLYLVTIALFFILGAELSELILWMMVSIAVYLIVSLLANCFLKKRKGEHHDV